MKTQEIKAMVSELAPVIREFVDVSFAPVMQRLSALEVRQSDRGEKGAAGERGEKGDPGQDGPPGRDGKDGRDGVDGRDAPAVTREDIIAALASDPSIIAEAVARHLDAHPPAPGRDGKDGRDGVDGKDGARGDPGPAGPRGEKGAAGERGEKGDPGVPGEKGIPGQDGAAGRDGVGMAGAMIDRTGRLVVTMTDGTMRDLGPVVGRDGADGAQGKAGENGRDGFALKDFDAELMDDGRTILLKFDDGRDVSFAVEMMLPVMIYRGIYDPSRNYEKGDTVTWAGSLWHANEPTSSNPGDGKTWTLAAKKGRDGKEVVAVAPDRSKPVRV